MAYTSPPPPPAERGKKPIIAIAGAVAAVAMLGIVLVFMFGFTPSPSETVKEYVKLQKEREYVEMLEQTTTEQYAQRFREDKWDGNDTPTEEWRNGIESRGFDFEVTNESIEGDKATVTGEQTEDSGEPAEVNLDLVWEDGQWLIDSTDQS